MGMYLPLVSTVNPSTFQGDIRSICKYNQLAQPALRLMCTCACLSNRFRVTVTLLQAAPSQGGDAFESKSEQSHQQHTQLVLYVPSVFIIRNMVQRRGYTCTPEMGNPDLHRPYTRTAAASGPTPAGGA